MELKGVDEEFGLNLTAVRTVDLVVHLHSDLEGDGLPDNVVVEEDAVMD